jgi:hypothetical protein
MEAQSIPVLPMSRISTNKTMANKFTLECLFMEVAGASAYWHIGRLSTLKGFPYGEEI